VNTDGTPNAHALPPRFDADRIMAEFRRRFADEPAGIVRAPGRVNLIGEHTDYNDGFVLPLAVDRFVWVAYRPCADDVVRVWSMEFDEEAEFSLHNFSPGGTGWMEYVKGVAWALSVSGGKVHGWEGIIGGDLPLGAGLSSSAALEVACAHTFADIAGMTWDDQVLAQVAQTAENNWIGVKCGIMDPLISISAREGHAILIDCRSLTTTQVPLPPQMRVVILDTGTRRSLTNSAYNDREQECREAARAFRVDSLRDLTRANLAKPPKALAETLLKRARHVITENARVHDAVDALYACDWGQLGSVMREGHRSLRDDYEVSSPALDTMVECASRAGSVGARMTGAGFGGCVVAVVKAEDATRFLPRVTNLYYEATGLQPRAFVSQASAGATSTASRTRTLHM
jgi:galactokinase